MGTQREPRETPVEFVEVPLLTVLSMTWGMNYMHACLATMKALDEAHIEHGVVEMFLPIFPTRVGMSVLPSTRCEMSVVVRVRDACELSSLRIKRSNDGLHVINLTPDNLNRPFLPEAIVQCRVTLELAKLDDSERAQLGLEVVR